MKRNGRGKSRYLVSPGENVTVVFTPINVGEEFVAVGLDGNPKDPDPNSPVGTPTFSFPVSSEVHVMMIQCTFVDPNPGNPEPRFDSQLKAELGGVTTGPFDGPTVKKSDPLKRIAIRFSTS
jgi:hypothetical protein